MNRVIVSISVAILWASGFAIAQEEGEHRPPKPTLFHKHLKQFVGTWDAKAKSLTEPGKPPVEFRATERIRLMPGGLWLIFDYKGKMGETSFTVHGVSGYDSKKKKFVSSWIDSRMDILTVSEGTCNEAGKVFTMVYELPNPHGGEPTTMKHVSQVTGADMRTLTYLVKMPDGKFMKVGTVEYTRKKKEPKRKKDERK